MTAGEETSPASFVTVLVGGERTGKLRENLPRMEGNHGGCGRGWGVGDGWGGLIRTDLRHVRQRLPATIICQQRGSLKTPLCLQGKHVPHAPPPSAICPPTPAPAPNTQKAKQKPGKRRGGGIRLGRRSDPPPLRQLQLSWEISLKHPSSHRSSPTTTTTRTTLTSQPDNDHTGDC